MCLALVDSADNIVDGQTIGSSFTALETKITGVGRTAVRIGQSSEMNQNADLLYPELIHQYQTK